ncbi:FCD domain-containing protein [Streptomyces sp. NPDC048636]|uniref:FadR/GntR family transcriptional regulator n=1 Tax=Streptomyces sp. NPDC048636 TaxID=3155762 RepID=UPI0034394F2E
MIAGTIRRAVVAAREIEPIEETKGRAVVTWREVGDKSSVPERVATEILRFINSKSLVPGDQLPPERTLAELLGVSRPSVREGAKYLEARGHLVVRRGQGVFIQRPPIYEGLRHGMDERKITFRHLFDMREVLEVPAAGWAADIQDQTALDKVETALEELNAAAAADVKDWNLIRYLDSEFHMRIVAAAGNPFLDQTLGVLNELLRGGMETTINQPGRLAKSRAEHARILTALRSGDPTKARSASRSHIRAAYRAAMSAKSREDGMPSA